MTISRGVLVYLNSGECRTFPTATRVEMTSLDLLVFRGAELLGAVSRSTLWSCVPDSDSASPA